MANNVTVPSMQDLLEAGVHFGHKVSRGNPRMKDYIFGARDGVHIIDLAKSEEKLKEAVEGAYKMGQSGKVMLVVGTKKQAQSIVEELAKKAGLPYLTNRWMGGLLTNFEEMRKNIRKLNTLKEQQEKGQLSHYTKKEQLLISRKVEKFESELGGVSHLEKVPDVMLVIDAVSDNIAVREAQRLGLQVIGLCDSNANPDWFDYPVPANDDGIKSIKINAETLIAAYIKGKEEYDNHVAEVEKKAQEEKAAAEEAAKNPKKETKTETKSKSTTEEMNPAPVEDEQTAVIEEEIEKKIVDEHDRKIN